MNEGMGLDGSQSAGVRGRCDDGSVPLQDSREYNLADIDMLVHAVFGVEGW